MNDEQAVRQVYEFAESFNIYPHVCGVFKHCDDESPIGVGLTEGEAWADARSKLSVQKMDG